MICLVKDKGTETIGRNKGNTNVFKYGLGNLLIEYMGDRDIVERTILQ